MKPRFFGTTALIAATALAGCSHSDPVTPGSQVALAGTYSAAGGGQSFGAITFQADTADISRDMLAEGASIVLSLNADGTTAGRLFIPADAAGVPDLDEDLTGTWSLDDGVVNLDHAADTFFRDMPLEVDGDRLVGDERFSGVRVQVTLQRVTDLDFDRVADGADDFEITADVAVMESFPVQLAGSLTFANRGSTRLTLQTDDCWPLMRAYRPGDEPGEDRPVWDQAEEGACAMLVPRLDAVDPGDSVRFESPVVSAADILDDELPDGTYRIGVYFAAFGLGAIEIDGGEVELAIPR